jgi:hypothetical protein
MQDYSSKSFLAHLYSKRLSTAVAAVIILIVLCIKPFAVDAQRKKNSGPRSLAVVTWNGDSPTPEPGTSVLTPVAILVEGRFYDAELYQAQPEPLAVDAGVIYDVLKNGDPIGTFNVGGSRQDKGIWYGLGRFEAKKEKSATPAKSSSATPSAPVATDDDRPKLRRGPAPPPPPKQQTDEVLNNIDRDPERPTLRRQTAEERRAKIATAPAKEFVPPAMHMAVAISDAGGPEPRPFTFRAKSGEVDQLRAAMEKLARAELDKLRKTPKPAEQRTAVSGKQRTHHAAASLGLALQDASFGVYDVNGNNAPVMLYSAAAMVDGMKRYITVAAWEEIDESLRKIFAQVTDDRHLDVYPRLEIIDAVDARGNGRGELLFRAFGDQGNRFVLYHPGPDSLELLFDSASGG